MGDWFTLDKQGRPMLALKIQPRARRAAIAGLVDEIEGPALKIAVTAPPEDGKANEAVIAALARALDIAKSRIEIVAGASGRRKLARLAVCDRPTLDKLRQWNRA